MGKHNGQLLRAAREHVFGLFHGAADRLVLEHHHFARTREMVDACKEIARGSRLDDEAREVALLCAWFYDTCYTSGSDDHGASLELCLQFLEQQQGHRPSPEQIAACFRGAEGERTGAQPGEAVEEVTPADVLHDGRLALLAARDYVERIELLRFELQRRAERTFSEVEWTQHCITFFEAHPYRTAFAQLLHGGGRAANLAQLQRRLRKELRQVERARADGEHDAAERVGRSAEGLYYRFNQIQLGLIRLADHRTSTMIRVNAIMISVVLALLARRIGAERDLLAPTALLLLVNVVVVFLAIGSMRTARERLSPDEVRALDTNLMSFFNENPVPLSEYTEHVSELVADPPQFQRKVLEHLYVVRRALDGRARRLRLTYRVFLWGISASVLAFLVVLARR